MALGKPVVAFDVGGVSEMLADGEVGTLVPPRDTKALAEQFLRYLRDPELRAAQGQAARARVEQSFDAARQGRRIQNQIVEASGLAEPA
jgi:glycosyltransferase involved in cell wall biosynthesis